MESSDVLDSTLLFSAMLHRAARWMGTAHGYIALLSPLTQRMEIVYGMGIGEAYVDGEISLGEGLGGTVWETGEVIAVSDYRSWERRATDERVRDASIAIAVMGVPIRLRNDVVGVIGLFSLEEGRVFTRAEIDFFTKLGEIAGTILENASKEDSVAVTSHIESLNQALPTLIPPTE
jgi:GAF domain-containing protein